MLRTAGEEGGEDGCDAAAELLEASVFRAARSLKKRRGFYFAAVENVEEHNFRYAKEEDETEGDSSHESF